MELGQTVVAAISIGALMISVLTIVFGRTDKSSGDYREVLKQISELALQVSNLRTEIAVDALKRSEEMRRSFVSREEHEEHRQMVMFLSDLTREVHRRMHPDAAIHQPGGAYAHTRNG